jgi:hypothetical protein
LGKVLIFHFIKKARGGCGRRTSIWVSSRRAYLFCRWSNSGLAIRSNRSKRHSDGSGLQVPFKLALVLLRAALALLCGKRAAKLVSSWGQALPLGTDDIAKAAVAEVARVGARNVLEILVDLTLGEAFACVQGWCCSFNPFLSSHFVLSLALLTLTVVSTKD